MITTSRLLMGAGLSTAIAASVAVSEVAAQEVKLPAALTFTAYDTGTSGFNIAVAVGKGLKEKFNVGLRVLPAANDVARLALH
jgi:hypothetical protein